MTKPSIIEYLLLACLALLWGSSYLFISVSVASIPPATLIAARVAIAALVLFAVMRWRGERLPRDGRTWRQLGIQAVFNSIGAWTLLAWGQQYVDSGLSSVLNSTSPVFVVLAGMLASGGTMAHGWKLLGVGLGVAGVVTIMGPEVLDGLGQDVLAQAAILGGAILYACAALYGRRFSRLPATVTATGTMIVASGVLIPASIVLDRPWTLAPSVEAMMTVLILGTACTGLALLIYFRLVRTLGAAGVASQSYLRSGIGVVLGMAVLGETLSPETWVGIVLAIAGVIAINRPVAALAAQTKAG